MRERVAQISNLVRQWMGVTSAVEPQLVVLATLAKLCVNDHARQAELICDEMLTVLQNSDNLGRRLSSHRGPVPVLSISQFEHTLAVARFAAQHGFSSVQLRALKLALTDRTPTVTADSSRAIRMLFADCEVLQPSEEVFAVLMESVFMTKPLMQLHFHAKIADPTTGLVENVAESLVTYAVKLNKLDKVIEANQLQITDRVSQKSMDVLIHLAKNENASAHEKLVDLLAVVRFQQKSSYDSLPIMVAAHKAYDQPDLKSIATTILNSLGAQL